jgi:hypothetical protein
MKIYKLALLCFIRGVVHVSAHGVQVAHCETPAGNLRVFVEHWHGSGQTASAGDTITLQVTAGGVTTNPTVPASGVIPNTYFASLPGCAVGTLTTDSSCSGANGNNDWGYWDFAPASCGLATTVKLLKGNSCVYDEGCGNLYPTEMVVSDDFGCTFPTSAPTPMPAPTSSATPAPTHAPTSSPSETPSSAPTSSPSETPSSAPSFESVSHDVCQNFAVHARTTVTFDGVLSTIYGGDVSVSPGTSITGAYAINGGQVVEDSSAFAESVLTAHAEAMAVHPNEMPMAIEMGGLTFTPGTYRSGSAINFAYGTTVTLDGLNEPNPVFLFIAGSTLVTAADTTFILKNGAKAENVHWALGTAATLGARSVVEGSILAGTAITFGTKSILHGCALALSAITFESDGSIETDHYIAVRGRHLRGYE